MTKVNVIQPGTIEAPPGDMPFLLLPERNTFQARASRLRALAEGHALADYLRFLAALARAQHESLSLFRRVLLPEAQELERCREHGMPPLGTRGWVRDPVWREALRGILTELEAGTLPEAGRATAARLKDTNDASLERVAETLLAGDYDETLDRAAIPFIGAALQALTPLLKPSGGWRPEDLTAFRQRQQPAVTASGARLAPAAVLRLMRQILPRDTILTTDAGQHKVYASRLWQCYQPLDYLTSSGLGTMGVAIPIAITAKLVRRHRPVVALTGDGGFLMRMSELETARREGLPIIIVIFNDGYLNLIKIKQEHQGYAVLGSQFAPVDYAHVATGFGFQAARVDSEATLQDALQQAVASGEPWVVDVLIDPEGYV